MALFRPDRYFARLTRIDIDRDLIGAGFENALLDIDNTILSRATGTVPRDVGVWLARARDAGVTFCLVSNNWHANVHELAGALDLPIVAKAMKPFPAAFMRGRSLIGARRENTVMIGDQLMTDVVGAHLAGMQAYLLAPLVEQDLPHTLLLRNLERALMRGAAPEDAAPEGAAAAASGGSEAAGDLRAGAVGEAKGAHRG